MINVKVIPGFERVDGNVKIRIENTVEVESKLAHRQFYSRKSSPFLSFFRAFSCVSRAIIPLFARFAGNNSLTNGK